MIDNADAVALINRHMARLLSNLEDAGCPSVFRNEVRSEMKWLRDDLCPKERTNNHANQINP